MEQAYLIAEIIGGAIILIGALAFAFTYGKGKLGQETIDLMTANKKAQDEAILRLENDSTEKGQRISHLSGQVDMLKDVPLREINASMKTLSQSHEMLSKYMSNHDAALNEGVNKIITHIDEVIGSKK